MDKKTAHEELVASETHEKLILSNASYFRSLFDKAFSKNPFGTLCTVLRVDGLQDANWDPFEASIETTKAFSKLMDRIREEEEDEKTVTRIALLLYCHLLEMTAPHEMIMNLLRCLSGERYIRKPFGKLVKKIGKTPFKSIPPSAKRKFIEILKIAKSLNEDTLCGQITSFFNDDVRNAFSHSDYILTDTHFRWTEGGLASQMELEKVVEVIHNCFAFYDAFLHSHTSFLEALARLPKYHKWPDYLVLELLSENSKVYGFCVHFSNGSKATYSRTANGTECTNITLERDGTISFFWGSLDDLVPVWKIDGKPFDKFNQEGS